MTRRWVCGKEPTKAEVKTVITNAVAHFLDNSDVEAIASAVINFYKGRAENRH